MNVGRHVARLNNLGFSLLLALVAPLSSQPAGTTTLAGASPSSNATRGPNQERHVVPSELAPVHFITFRNKYGQTRVLDWKGDRVMYSGDLPIDQGTDAFFKSLYVGKTCSDGTAVRDASTKAYFDSLMVIPASIRSSSLISQNVS